MTATLIVRRDTAAFTALRKQIRRGGPVDPDAQIETLRAELAACGELLALIEPTPTSPDASHRGGGSGQPARGRPG